MTVYLETDCGNTKGAGKVGFDCVQLEAGSVANDYNIIEDGSFELTEDTLPYNWKALSKSSIKVKDERVKGGVDGEYCYHITGQPGIDKYLRFSADLGSAKNSYVLSGWVKTESTPIRKGRDLKVVAYHKEEDENGTVTEELKVSADINAYSEGWKYFTLIIPAAKWKSTSFTIRFYDNIGDLYIDGLQLTRNDVQTKKYDSEGRVTSKYTTLKSADYTYDSYNRLKTQTTPAGAKSTYTYSKTGDTTKITSDISPNVYMEYDKYGNQISGSTYDPDASTKKELYTESTYTEDGNFEKTSTDNAGNVTAYEYNTLTGQLEKTILPARGDETPVVTDYIYDSEDRISKVTQGDRSVSYTYGEFDDLTGITHNGFTYNYTYDGFGNVLTSSIAGTTICTNEYAPNNGSLIRSVFADGTATGTTYDAYGKVTSNSLNGITISKYVYDNDGNVAKKTDALGNVTTKYDYNDSGMLVRSEVYKGESTASKDLESRMQYTYTKSGKVGALSYEEKDSGIKTYTYTYAKDDKPTKSTLPDGSSTAWSYDSLRRNTKIVYTPKEGAASDKKLYTTLGYQDVELTTAEGKTKKATTGLVSEYTNKFGSSGTTVSCFRYVYDAWGNITDIRQSGTDVTEAFKTPLPSTGVDKLSGSETAATSVTAENSSFAEKKLLVGYSQPERQYTYNDFGEVVTAKETYADRTTKEYSYVYDAGGNIVTETINGTKHTYTYDSKWKDKLVSYDGKAITYDVFGCPLNYMGSTMTWDIYGGLTSVKKGKDTITYTYMGDGQRRSKTVNGVTTTYHYNNGMLLSETTGNETLRYYYDSTGKVASITYQKGNEEERGYFYTRNAQGDIIGIYRSSDSALVATYEYDLWGKPVRTISTLKDSDKIAAKNPFRYRGYYYDSETGFYYLNARYYDPQIRRFISADSMNVLMIATTDVTCKNLFAYSENNPVMNKDSSGAVAETVFDVISLAGSIVEVCCNPMDTWAWAGAVGDAVDLIPFATGVGEAVRGVRAVAKAADKVDDAVDTVTDAAKVVKKSGKDTTRVRHYTNSKGLKGIEESGTIIAKWNESALGQFCEKTANSVRDFYEEHKTAIDGFMGGAAYHVKNPKCFVAGTLIVTAVGMSCVEDIRPGDYVYAKNEATGEQAYMPVLQTYENEIDVTYTITINGESIETTAGHPFYTEDEGWIGADKLETGDKVELTDGSSGTVVDSLN